MPKRHILGWPIPGPHTTYPLLHFDQSGGRLEVGLNQFEMLWGELVVYELWKTCTLHGLGKWKELWCLTCPSSLLSQVSWPLKPQNRECMHLIRKTQETSWKIRLKILLVCFIVHESMFSRCQIHSYWAIHGVIQDMPSWNSKIWFLNCWKWIVHDLNTLKGNY